MALKSYEELREIDVEALGYCDYREAKDDNGKKIQVPYLNWARCKELLHENGAKVVYFEPVTNANGSSLFMSDVEFKDKNGNVNRCYEVRVKVVIDDLQFEMQTPLMNGSFVVRDDTINQLRIGNAQARAFVKGVAIHTGLGFGLWLKDSEETPQKTDDDLYFHQLAAIRKRVEQLVTMKLQNGLTMDVICERLGKSEEEFKAMFAKYAELYNFEKSLAAL